MKPNRRSPNTIVPRETGMTAEHGCDDFEQPGHQPSGRQSASDPSPGKRLFHVECCSNLEPGSAVWAKWSDKLGESLAGGGLGFRGDCCGANRQWNVLVVSVALEEIVGNKFESAIYEKRGRPI